MLSVFASAPAGARPGPQAAHQAAVDGSAAQPAMSVGGQAPAGAAVTGADTSMPGGGATQRGCGPRRLDCLHTCTLEPQPVEWQECRVAGEGPTPSCKLLAMRVWGTSLCVLSVEAHCGRLHAHRLDVQRAWVGSVAAPPAPAPQAAGRAAGAAASSSREWVASEVGPLFLVAEVRPEQQQSQQQQGGEAEQQQQFVGTADHASLACTSCAGANKRLDAAAWGV